MTDEPASNLKDVIHSHCREAARARKFIVGWRLNREAYYRLMGDRPEMFDCFPWQGDGPKELVGRPFEIDREDVSEEPLIEPVFAQPVRRERPVYVDRDHELRFMNACVTALNERKRMRSESE